MNAASNMDIKDLPRKGDVIMFAASNNKYEVVEDFHKDSDNRNYHAPVKSVSTGQYFNSHTVKPDVKISFVSRAPRQEKPFNGGRQPILADRYLLYLCPTCHDAWDKDEGYCPHCVEPFVPCLVAVDKSKSKWAEPSEV